MGVIGSPSSDAARRIARDILGEEVSSVARFTMGAGNWVYDVTSATGRQIVIRFVRDREAFAAGIFWNRTLRPFGVPLPEMLDCARTPDADTIADRWVALERLPGVDLGRVYTSLSAGQKVSILDGVMRAQQIVHSSIAPGTGFGYAVTPDKAPEPTWTAVITKDLNRSRRRIHSIGVVDPQHVTRVERLQPSFEDYFSSIQPIPFLDDTTTRNVIVHDGALAGIVDVDSICYGDPLLVPALTRMSLLAMGCDTIYTDAWLERLHPSADQRRAFDFYTACFALNFLGEQGQQFNRDAPPPVDLVQVERLLGLLDGLVQRLA